VIKPLFNLLEEKHHKLDELFVENVYYRSANDGTISNEKIDVFERELKNLFDNKEENNSIYNLTITIRHHAYQNNDMNIFSVIYKLSVYFGEYKYSIQYDDQVLASFTYSKIPLLAEIEAIVTRVVKENLEDIKRRIKRE
jgi:hypothetical protein